MLGHGALPGVFAALRIQRRPTAPHRIYVKVKGRWRYLYRAIDKDGATLDFFLSERRGAKAAKRFLGAALKRSRDWIPRVISTDKNPAYGEAIAALKKDGTIPRHVEHRQAKYLNNRLEADHGQLKRLIRPTLGSSPCGQHGRRSPALK
jgi:IS6 family transposase